MRKSIWLVCLLSFKLFYGQKVEILNKSGFQHNYAVKSFEYIEDANDTSKLNYMATLKMTGKADYYTGNVVRWVVKIRATAKKIGANAFCLQEYRERDSIGTLVINVYFAGDYFLKANKLKANKSNIYLFGTSTHPQDSADFYLNGSKKVFSSTKNYLINTSLNIDYNIAVTENKLTNLPVKYKSEEKSRYFIIPKSKAPTASFKPMKNPANKGSAGFAAAAIFGPVGVAAYSMASYGPNRVIEIPYNYGRLMSDVFK